MNEYSDVIEPTVAIIGAGPAGLRAAQEMAKSVSGEVLVLERESEAGGIPRHSDHLGYGIRDLKRVMTGPNYARRITESALKAGASIMTNAMVTGWGENKELIVTSPKGRTLIRPQAVVIATGARERPRPARMIVGDRPRGVFTTGQLQNLVHLHGQKVGKKAVVVGAELVSWSAVMTLSHSGCKTAMLTTEYPYADSYALFAHFGKVFFRTRVKTSTKIVRIIGRPRVTGVEIEDVNTKKRQIVECDTVVFTGDWIPDNELARMAKLIMDPATKGPVVDNALRTSTPGIFAAGNVLHPVETADVAALDGLHVVSAVKSYLAGKTVSEQGISLKVAPPLRWMVPGVYRDADDLPARDRLLTWTDKRVLSPVVAVEQSGKIISKTRVAWPAVPGRVFRIPTKALRGIDASAGPATFILE